MTEPAQPVPLAFTHLLRIRALLERDSPILSDEWTDTRAILVATTKQRSRSCWRAEELARDDLLDSDTFQTGEAEAAQVPHWLGSTGDRRIWQDTLNSRGDQQSSIQQAVTAAVADAEEATLPNLRDGFVHASGCAGSRPG
jgi:hypothetical protein